MSRTRRTALSRADALPLVAVAAVAVALWVACWPFADVGVNDDFGYAHVALRLLETGRLQYNGWCSPILGVQAAWGALFAWALGFSHDAMRLSTLPFAAACATLTYALHRRFDVPRGWSAFAAILLVGSPLCVPWSASFMTDVPGLAFTLAILHAAVSLVRADGRRATAGWAIAVVALGLAGGSIRQTNLALAALVLAAEALRRWRSWPLEIVLALGVHVATTAWMVRWYARQPFATPDPPILLGSVSYAFFGMFALAATLALCLVPLGLALLRFAGVRRAVVVQILVASVVACAASVAYAADTPLGFFAVGLWVGNTITATGFTADGLDAPGARPVVLGVPARVAMAAATFWLVAVAAVAVVRHRRAIGARVERLVRGAASRDAVALAVLLLLGLAYAAMLVPRASLRHCFDRYVLVPIPIVSVVLLAALRGRLRDGSPGGVAWAAVALYAAAAVAMTRDHFAELRARDAVAATLVAEGVPREQIANGLTFDGWTQLAAAGYVNDFRIVNPPGAFVVSPEDERREKMFWFLSRAPVVRPRWIVVNVPELPASLGDRRAVGYRMLLPPRTGWLLAWPVRDATSRPSGPAAVDVGPASSR